MTDKVIKDCHYCEYGSCADANTETVLCYSDYGFFSHIVENSVEEVEECPWFDYCDIFPKY